MLVFAWEQAVLLALADEASLPEHRLERAATSLAPRPQSWAQAPKLLKSQSVHPTRVLLLKANMQVLPKWVAPADLGSAKQRDRPTTTPPRAAALPEACLHAMTASHPEQWAPGATLKVAMVDNLDKACGMRHHHSNRSLYTCHSMGFGNDFACSPSGLCIHDKGYVLECDD